MDNLLFALTKPLKILIADDHPMFRRGLSVTLQYCQLGFNDKIVLEAANGKEVIHLASTQEIDLFILDFKMPELNGYEVAQALLAKNIKSRILIITMYHSIPLTVQLKSAGVLGVLPKDSGIEEIETAILLALKGEEYFPDKATKKVKHLASLGQTEFPLSFTERENQLVQLLAIGKSSIEIANDLGLTPKTIETYRSRLIEKTRTQNTTALIHYFQSNGLFKD